MIIYIVVLILISLLLIWTRGYPYIENEEKAPIPYLMKGFYRAGNFLTNNVLSGNKRIGGMNENVVLKLKILHPHKRKSAMKEFYSEKFAIVLMLVYIGALLAIGLELQQRSVSLIKDGNYIEKTSYGEGAKNESLRISVEGLLESEELNIEVQERQYSSDEVPKMFEEVLKQLDEVILGENTSFDEVRSDLNLVRTLTGYPIQIEWSIDSYKNIDQYGSLNQEEIPEGGTRVCLDAVITYYDYKTEYQIYATILPAVKSEKEVILDKIKEEIVSINEGKEDEEQLILPQSIEGRTIQWSSGGQNMGLTIFILCIIGSAGLYFAKDQEITRELDQRNQQLMLDFPEMVSKLNLLIGAGMTIQRAFHKVAMDYSIQKKQYNAKRSGKLKDKDRLHRYVYEEMLISCYEMQSGVSEVVAYENFGQRCRLPRYMKFSTLLSQNLKKGSRGLSQMLETEMIDAFEERKNIAKKLGEEASTKLLLPMIIMLIIVLVILIVPACLSFQI